MKTVQSECFEKTYPGRTLIVGMTPSGAHYAQVYWIMGRSANSRNRVFELEGDSVRNKAYDPALMEDTSLIIYDPIRSLGDLHIVTNGDQTDTICDGYLQGLSFQQSLMYREFEPDAPHFTPRISAVLDAGKKAYTLSILKTAGNDPSICLRQFFDYSGFKAGIGHCIHTYDSEEEGVLRPFQGEPFEAPLFDSIDETADFYWNRINADNKIAILVKHMDASSGEIAYAFRDRHGKR